ncbi:MAG TPA: hypothetical protein VHU85_10195 [Acidimicrobiales bacterium]|nr:hypothetical protein [Acidimicrobiales bacterium]
MSYRRVLQGGLGLLWLLDAALQFQPYMFTHDFVNQTIASTAGGNPGVVAQPITWASNLMLHHIAVYDVFFAAIQLALALGLFWRPTVKVALPSSIAWSVTVWWLGEGLGGVLTGGTSVYMGAPGAAVLYAFAAVLLWPRDNDAGPCGSLALGGPLGRFVPRGLWLTLWGSFVYFILQPGDRAPNALSAMASGMSDGEPGWLRSLDHTMAGALAHHGLEVSIAVAVLCIVVAISPFFVRLNRLGVIAAVLFGGAIWLMEDFGGIFTGHGTDPNSGILIILLAATFWPLHRAEPDQRRRGRSSTLSPASSRAQARYISSSPPAGSSTSSQSSITTSARSSCATRSVSGSGPSDRSRQRRLIDPVLAAASG